MKPVLLPGLRYRGLWVSLGVLLLLAIALACLVPGKNLPDIGGSDKFKHAVSFGLLAFWFGSIVARTNLAWVGVAVVAFGGVIELLQGAMGLGRTAEWLDAWADVLGVVLGLGLVFTPLGRWPAWFDGVVAKVAR